MHSKFTKASSTLQYYTDKGVRWEPGATLQNSVTPLSTLRGSGNCNYHWPITLSTALLTTQGKKQTQQGTNLLVLFKCNAIQCMVLRLWDL